ncbi:lipoxygenase, partial [Genlisea aurea]
RGMLIDDASRPSGYRLAIEDYPYAVDGLEIWGAIEEWVTEYCSFYYPTDEKIRDDSELQSWWTEVREKGHHDRRHEKWWPKMQTGKDLVHVCTTTIWTASALHAAVNFGQYPYAGYMPNRPTITRRLMPLRGTTEYEELERNPDGVFLKTVTSQFQTLIGISLIEILSRHSRDEIYLGQRESPEWTDDAPALTAFERFRLNLIRIEKKIEARNRDPNLKNRHGPVRMNYTLLHPNTSDTSRTGGLAGKGIPNSISI